VKPAIIGALAVMLAAPAMAADDLPLPVARTLGNSLHYQAPDTHFAMVIRDSADHRYEAVVDLRDPAGRPVHLRMSGRWTIEGDRICRQQTSPPPPPGHDRICEAYGAYPAPGESRTDPATGLILTLVLTPAPGSAP